MHVAFVLGVSFVALCSARCRPLCTMAPKRRTRRDVLGTFEEHLLSVDELIARRDARRAAAAGVPPPAAAAPVVAHLSGPRPGGGPSSGSVPAPVPPSSSTVPGRPDAPMQKVARRGGLAQAKEALATRVWTL